MRAIQPLAKPAGDTDRSRLSVAVHRHLQSPASRSSPVAAAVAARLSRLHLRSRQPLGTGRRPEDPGKPRRPRLCAFRRRSAALRRTARAVALGNRRRACVPDGAPEPSSTIRKAGGRPLAPFAPSVTRRAMTRDGRSTKRCDMRAMSRSLSHAAGAKRLAGARIASASRTAKLLRRCARLPDRSCQLRASAGREGREAEECELASDQERAVDQRHAFRDEEAQRMPVVAECSTASPAPAGCGLRP